MATCAHCGDSVRPLGYECAYCDELHCRAHRLPESHACERLETARPPTATASAADADATTDLSRGASHATDADLATLRERAKQEAERVPYDVVEPGTVGTRPEPDYDSSPDVALDGSIATEDRADTEDGWSPLLVALVVVLVVLVVAAAVWAV